MPSDDKSKYDDDDIFTRDEEDLFKKYSLKEGKNYRNEKDSPGNYINGKVNSGDYGNEKDFIARSRDEKIFEARLRGEKDFPGSYDKYEDHSGDKGDKDFGFVNEDGGIGGLKKERQPGSFKDMENEGFFEDEDFSIKDFGEEDQYNDGGFRSIKTKKKKTRIRRIIASLIIMAVLVVIAIGIVYGYRFIKNKYFSSTEAAAATTEQSIVVPGSMKLGKYCNMRCRR
jgi:hypothetical protein